MPLPYGVPQGSILGLLLFILMFFPTNKSHSSIVFKWCNCWYLKPKCDKLKLDVASLRTDENDLDK